MESANLRVAVSTRACVCTYLPSPLFSLIRRGEREKSNTAAIPHFGRADLFVPRLDDCKPPRKIISRSRDRGNDIKPFPLSSSHKPGLIDLNFNASEQFASVHTISSSLIEANPSLCILFELDRARITFELIREWGAGGRGGIDTMARNGASGKVEKRKDNLAGSFARGSIYLSIKQDGRGEKSVLLCFVERIMTILMLFLSFFFFIQIIDGEQILVSLDMIVPVYT